MMFDAPTEPCPVCAETITDLKHFAECDFCAKPFHLRMTENAPDQKDCGIVEFDDTASTMYFTCLTCWRAAYEPAAAT